MDDNLRNIDIKIAHALGFTVVKGIMYSPKGTTLGGDLMVKIGSKEMTLELMDDIWKSYTPRFSSNMQEAIWLLDFLYQKWMLEYALYREGTQHTCDFGWYGREAGHRDQIWTAREESASLAVCNAILQCPAVMGQKIVIENDEALNKHFDGVMIPVEDIAGKYSVPGWKCNRCGWTIGSKGFPPSHDCPTDGEIQQSKFRIRSKQG